MASKTFSLPIPLCNAKIVVIRSESNEICIIILVASQGYQQVDVNKLIDYRIVYGQMVGSQNVPDHGAALLSLWMSHIKSMLITLNCFWRIRLS